MLCPRCGKSVGSSVKLCPACTVKERENAGQGFGAKPEVDAIPETCPPAGFWLRFFATFADGALTSLVTLGGNKLLIALTQSDLNNLFKNYLGNLLESTGDSETSSHFLLAGLIAYTIALAGLFLMNSLVWIVYHALFEASPLRASPGKLMIGIRVTTLNGGQVSLPKAFARNACKIISSLTLCIGYLIAGVTRNKQALHDIMTGCLVQAKPNMPPHIRALGCVASISLALAIFALVGANDTEVELENIVKTQESSPSLSYSISNSDQNNSNRKSYRGTTSKEDVDPVTQSKQLQGTFHGSRFQPEKITFSRKVKTLTFRTGTEFFADQQITIFLFDELASLPGKIYRIGRDTKGIRFPHVHISRKTSNRRTPETKILMRNYALYLRIHGISGSSMRGDIKLLVPGKKGVTLSGGFAATIE